MTNALDPVELAAIINKNIMPSLMVKSLKLAGLSLVDL